MPTATQPIVMHFTERLEPLLIATPAYEIKFGRWAWVERTCVWLLRKTRGLVAHFDKEAVYRRVYIDRDEAARKIILMASEQLVNMTGKKPSRILVGRKEFNELISDSNAVPIWNSFEFSIELKEQTAEDYSPYRTSLRLFEVPVQVIPWMDGILVL